MNVCVTGKIAAVERAGPWHSFNFTVAGGYVKVIVESSQPLPYVVGDTITVVTSKVRLEGKALKLFALPGFVGKAEDE